MLYSSRMPVPRRVIVVDNSAVARRVGGRIREARVRAGLTQAEVARGRYTAAYISALERGLAKPSMAALTFISERLGVAVRDLVSEDEPSAGRLEADILLAAGQHTQALDRYDALLADATDRRLRAELLRGKAEALCRLHRGGDAIGPASESVELFGGIGLEADGALAKYWLSYAHYLQDNPAEARGLLLKLLAQERAGLHVAPDFRFRLLTSLGHVEASDGQPERALTYMEEAKSLTEGLSLMQRAAFLSGLSLQYRHTGDLELVAENPDSALESHIADNEATLAWARGDADAAEERISAALSALQRGGSFLAAAGAHVTRARIARARGDASAVRASYEEAVTILREHGARARLRDVLAEWADYMGESGDLASANRLYAEALGRLSGEGADRRSQVGTGAGEH